MLPSRAYCLDFRKFVPTACMKPPFPHPDFSRGGGIGDVTSYPTVWESHGPMEVQNFGNNGVYLPMNYELS